MADPRPTGPSSRNAARWHPVGGSVRGSSHEVSGKPNQDSWAVSAPGEIAAGVVADGHGSERSARSDHGSRVAADLALSALESAAHAAPEPAALEHFLRTESGPWIVSEWRSRVLAHASEHPFTTTELAAIGTPTPAEWETLRAYGCTLVGMCATPLALGLLQLGDGDIVAVTTGRTSLLPMPEDPSSVAQFTSSLCQDEPLRALRVAAIDLARTPIALAFASTDGFGTAYADTNWWQEVGPQMAERAAAVEPEAFAQKVTAWLTEPARVAGDDATMVVLLARDGAGAAFPPGDEDTTQIYPPHHVLPRPPRRPRSTSTLLVGALAGAAVVGAAVAAIALVGGGGGGPEPSATPTSQAPGKSLVPPALKDERDDKDDKDSKEKTDGTGVDSCTVRDNVPLVPDCKTETPSPAATPEVPPAAATATTLELETGTWRADGMVLRWEPKDGGPGDFTLDFPAPITALERDPAVGTAMRLLIFTAGAKYIIELDEDCPGDGAGGCVRTCEELAAGACKDEKGTPA
ncbi:MAG: protein phosphatase 2C domain-containing protein [Sporichthyaceae bacterium]